MTLSDARGLPVTGADDGDIAAVDRYTARLLRIAPGAEAILEDAPRFPGSPMVQMAAAGFCLFGQARPADTAARAFLQAAEPLLPSATERERRHHDVLSRWLRHDHLGALEAAEAITRQWPRDMLAVKYAEFFYYVLGQQHEGPRFLAHMQRLADANAGDADFLAIHAFAHELCGDVPQARSTVDRALAIEQHNPWAHHCVAHIHLRQGDTADAVRVLESYLPLWLQSGRFAQCHNAWHLALAHLETLNRERAIELFRAHVWGITPDFVFEQVDAIALLWRLEMAGAMVDALWEDVAAHAEAHLGEHYMPFLDAHFVYALARTGRDDQVMAWLRQVDERTTRQDAEGRRSWATVGQPLIAACAALARNEAAECARLLDPVMPDVTLVGGSDAQVDLFRQAYCHALARSGRRLDAVAYWESVVADRPKSELDRYRLGLAA
ncbi:MAG: tetratricopeptide repeat protein [Acetobacteraceae bacterium]